MMTAREVWTNQDTTSLFKAVLALKTVPEAEAFFRDLCTLHELEELAGRWAVVRLLEQGSNYREISEATGASTATVTRIAQWLHHGTGGYRLLLDRLGLAAKRTSR
jgi:TrpR-related protein YerC/YecD